MKTADLLISAAGVEIFIFIAGCAILCADLFIPKHYRPLLHWAAVAAVVAAAVAAAGEFGGAPVSALNGFFVSTSFSAILKTAALLTAAGALIFSRHFLSAAGMLRGEFYALALFAVLGMSVMISAGHFLSLYLGLELMSLSLYAMIAMRGNSVAASEAAIKYFVLGALASGLFLYGVSILYGATGGALYFAAVADAAAGGAASGAALSLGLVFVLAGMAFKLGAAPFHMWLPDVYEGAPAPMTLFVAAAPKVAAMAMILHVLVGALPSMQAEWRDMLIVLALASLAVGNITAIAQTNIKRMLAYSAIAHSGFMALGVLSGETDGVAAAIFYVIIYALMTLGGFGIVTLLSTDGRENGELESLKGLSARNNIIAGVLAALMLSMAGIPPMVGFAAKLAVLQAVTDAGLEWLAVAAVLFSVIGAFYYLRVIKIMFFDAPAEEQENRLPMSGVLLAAAVGVLALLLGIFPNALLTACKTAALAIL